MNESEALSRAAKARTVLESDVFVSAFANVRAAILERIEKAPIRDTEGAEELRKCLRLLNDVRANLVAAIQDGKVVEFRLKQDEERRKNPFLGRLFR